MTFFKKATLATALLATSLTAASPAMADSYRGHRGGDTTGAAIAGGIIGLALGAIIVSSSNHRDDRYADRGWQYRDGYYWDRQGRRFDRDGRPRDHDNYYSRRGYRDGNGNHDGYGQRGDYDNDRGSYGRRW